MAQLVARLPLCPSFLHEKAAASFGMQPPLTHTWPAGQSKGGSTLAQGATQRPSTHLLPPWQLDAPDPVHGVGFPLQTLGVCVKSHA